MYTHVCVVNLTSTILWTFQHRQCTGNIVNLKGHQVSDYMSIASLIVGLRTLLRNYFGNSWYCSRIRNNAGITANNSEIIGTVVI